jgi:hypothetical protein
VCVCVRSASFQGISWIVFIHVFQGVRPHIFIKYKYIQANRARIRKNSLKRMDSLTFSFVNLLGLKWSVLLSFSFSGKMRWGDAIGLLGLRGLGEAGDCVALRSQEPPTGPTGTSSDPSDPIFCFRMFHIRTSRQVRSMFQMCNLETEVPF